MSRNVCWTMCDSYTIYTHTLQQLRRMPNLRMQRNAYAVGIVKHFN